MTSTNPTPAIVLDGVPTNIRLPEGSRATHVESDLYNIAERLREIDPNYRLTLLEHADGRAVWSVNELTRDGKEALIFRVGPGCEIDELDARVISKVQYLRAVPVHERLAKIEREVAQEKAKRAEEQAEAMYARLGEKMYSQLSRLGFIDTPRAESLPNRNATARRARSRRS